MLVSGLDSEINSSGNSTILVVSVISNLSEKYTFKLYSTKGTTTLPNPGTLISSV
jgi:hypothetical protein